MCALTVKYRRKIWRKTKFFVIAIKLLQFDKVLWHFVDKCIDFDDWLAAPLSCEVEW